MLDVLHVLFEEDTVAASREQYEVRRQFRTIIYPDMYGIDYAFAKKEEAPAERNQSYGNMAPVDEAPAVSGPTPTPARRRVLTPGGNHVAAQRSMVHKPYIPPTDMDIGANPFRPFQGLDAPLF